MDNIMDDIMNDNMDDKCRPFTIYNVRQSPVHIVEKTVSRYYNVIFWSYR